MRRGWLNKTSILWNLVGYCALSHIIIIVHKINSFMIFPWFCKTLKFSSSPSNDSRFPYSSQCVLRKANVFAVCRTLLAPFFYDGRLASHLILSISEECGVTTISSFICMAQNFFCWFLCQLITPQVIWGSRDLLLGSNHHFLWRKKMFFFCYLKKLQQCY